MIWRVELGKVPALVGLYKGVKVRMCASATRPTTYTAVIGGKQVAEAKTKGVLVKAIKAYINAHF